MSRHFRIATPAGFTLLPVVLTMSLIAAIAFLLNRDNGVNANLIGAQSDRERARYAAEAGLQAANYAIQNIQPDPCAGGYPISSSPVTDSNFGGAAYSAYANNNNTNTGSPLTLTSTGTYPPTNGASVTLTKTNAYVYQSGKRTWVTQPGSATTYVSSDWWRRDNNYGGDTVIRLENNNYQALLQFNLSPLPPKSQIVPWYNGVAGKLQPGATVSLYQQTSGTNTGTIEVYLINQSWVAGNKTGTGAADGATWDTYDGAHAWSAPGHGYDSRLLSTFFDPGVADWQDLDVTNAFQGWMSGVYPNYGVWVLAASSTISANSYVSSNDSFKSGQRPKLTTNYLLPCGATAPQSNVTLNPVADTQVSDSGVNDNENYGNWNTMTLQYNSSTDQYRDLLRFDLSSIPVGTAITSASLRLDIPSNATNTTSNPKVINAYALTESWVQGNGGQDSNATWLTRAGATTWMTVGGTYRMPSVAAAIDESSGSTPSASFRKGWLSFDLRALVQEWVNGVTPNNGVIIISTVADRMTISSVENNTTAERPQLVITY